MTEQPAEVTAEQSPYSVEPTTDLLADHTRVLKHQDSFAVFDRGGDAHTARDPAQGLFHRGTRFLSRLQLCLGDQRPLLLGSTVRDDNALLTLDLANPPLHLENGHIPADTIHIFRSRFLCGNVCYTLLRLTNHGMHSHALPLTFDFEADYADIFEVRGTRRARRGAMRPARVGEAELALGYQGLDGVLRRTLIQCEPPPEELTESRIRYQIELAPKEVKEIRLKIVCLIGDAGAAPKPLHHDHAFAKVCRRLQSMRAQSCKIRTSHEQFNSWINRSLSDLLLMTTDTEFGPYPYAGVPWFNTVFGRDGLITARECLWVNPAIARGVLRHLAAKQAETLDDSDDAEPGKIVHELREGEMAALDEVPFGRYYGSVDATPLFVMLAHDYYLRTGDRSTIESIWPAINGALEWLDRYGDRDQDGFIEYERHSPHGIVQQGWKDSDDSVFYEDGRLVEPPVALCEVQGYAYAARQAGAKLALLLGKSVLAVRLTQQAAELKERFTERFWCEELGVYALALDGHKNPCRVRSSNAGHCLFTGIATPDHAEKLMATLMGSTMFSGWGVRTVASTESRYNPMSYHNGSIWPHDNAIAAAGMARFGRKDHAITVLDALFHASLSLDMQRMPELFCGFPRRPGEGPTLYPVACAPQAWAAGAIFLLLEACLGIQIDGRTGSLRLELPRLPSHLDWMEIKNLTVGKASLDLRLRRAHSSVAVEVLDRRGDVPVTIMKRV